MCECGGDDNAVVVAIMHLNERDMQTLLTNLTAVLLALEILRERTPLTARQVGLADHALRAAQGIKHTLLARVMSQRAEQAAPPRRPAAPPAGWQPATEERGGTWAHQ
jgi:hypothetical protein